MTQEEREKLKRIYTERLEKAAQERSAALISLIKAAFANVSYPGEENLIASREHRVECEECRELFDFFAGKVWEDCLDEKSCVYLDAGQSFFKPVAWHYYLPAYLIQNINRKNFSSFYFCRPESYLEESDFVDYLVKESDFVEYLENSEQTQIDLLTLKQFEVIIGYLETVEETWRGIDEIEEENNSEALNYWRENYQKALAKEQNLHK